MLSWTATVTTEYWHSSAVPEFDAVTTSYQFCAVFTGCLYDSQSFSILPSLCGNAFSVLLRELYLPVEELCGRPLLRSAPTGCVQLPMEQTSVRQRSFVFHRPTVWNSLSSAVSLPTARFSKTVENVFIRTMKRHRAAFCAWLWHRESEKSLNSVHVNWTHSHYTTDKRADACTVCEQTDRFEKLWTDLVWNSSRQAVAYRRTDPYIMHGTD